MNPGNIEMSSAEQSDILRFVKIGIAWVCENISFDDAVRNMGGPGTKYEDKNEVKFVWYPGKVTSVAFIFKKNSSDEIVHVDSFKIEVQDNVTTNIPYTQFDSIGMHRIKRGEKIDDGRIEEGDFYVPVGASVTTPVLPANLTNFVYRVQPQVDSAYDIYGVFQYLADLKSENGPWNLENVRGATNLRALGIYRRYLTPNELNERNQAKREKYGYMNLCTGATCPETGIWEGWTKDGPTDVLRVEKGRKFDVVRTVSIGQSTTLCPMIAGQWMWLCSLEEQGNVTWNGMPFKS